MTYILGPVCDQHWVGVGGKEGAEHAPDLSERPLLRAQDGQDVGCNPRIWFMAFYGLIERRDLTAFRHGSDSD